jgi:hypothetical protein
MLLVIDKRPSRTVNFYEAWVFFENLLTSHIMLFNTPEILGIAYSENILILSLFRGFAL